MSLITHVTFVAHRMDPADQAFITTPAPDDMERQQRLESISMEGAGGTKSFVDDVYAAAFNYFQPGDIREWLESHEWSSCTSAVIVVDDENWSTDAIWAIEDGELTLVRDGVAY